ncbi:hypothetical protein K4K48_004501 [Colletotrichum sp. SAR 10_66]|nr:hypothetical protein K4K48_004501 [Colletotrichum sp. SAR 10_66]
MAPSIKDWPKLLSQAYRALKPGAWLEIQDIVPECKCDDGTMPQGQQYAPAKMMDLIKDGLAQFGVDLRAGKSHEGRIKAAGFQNLVHDTKKVPVGTWPKDSRLKSIGSYARAVIYDGLHANSAHAFFNDKLQQILDCFPASATSNTSKGTTTRDKTQSDNFFAVLGDSMDIGAAAPDDTEPSQARVDANPKPTIERPNMEPPARPLEKLTTIEDDHIMELICLFNDARDVRNFLKRTWTRYAERKTDLVTASLVTQASFQHLTDLELDFSRGYRFGFLDIMFGTLYTFCALGEAKHWLVMPTETEAKAFAYDNMQRIIRSGWIPTPEIDDWLMSDTLGMLDSIADVLSKGGQPTEDGLRPVLSKCSTNAEHFLPDTRRLAQLHIESKAMHPSIARVDLLATRLRDTIQRTRIRMSTAAMCRTFLDLYTISGLHSLVESDLKQFMSHRSIQHLIEIDKSSGIQDSLMKAHLDALFPPLNSDQKKLSVRNPLFLGSVLSSLILKLNSSELSLVNKGGSLMAAAHLYNALRVFNPQTMPRWHDLDLLIELQKEPMFAPKPPTEFAQCTGSCIWT